MSTQLSPTPVFKAFANDGTPLAYGLLYTYAAGTTTPQATFIDSTGTTPNTNPIILNARGECALWLVVGLSYKLNLTDLAGNQISGYPVDNIIAGATTVDSANISYDITAAETAAGVVPADLSVPNHLDDGIVRVWRYAKNTNPGSTALDTGLLNAIAVVAQLPNASGEIQLPGQSCLFANTLVFSPTPFNAQIKLRGQGTGVTRVICQGANGISFATNNILQEVSGMTIDCSGMTASGSGILMNAWRSLIEDVRLIAPASSTGYAIWLNNLSGGLFDVKIIRPYIGSVSGNGWQRNIYGVGNIGANTAITNFLILGGYLSGPIGANVKLSNAYDVLVLSTQIEGAGTNGYEIDNVVNFHHIGAAIEACTQYGVSFGANVQSVWIQATMENNVSGNFQNTGNCQMLVADFDGSLAIYGSPSIQTGFGLVLNSPTLSLLLSAGDASPQGVLTANAGSIFMNDQGGPPYVKYSGIGNTGWVPMGLGVASATAAQIASAAATINTTNKFTYEFCWDTTNNRMMVAQGSLTTSPWIICNGGTTVTPS